MPRAPPISSASCLLKKARNNRSNEVDTLQSTAVVGCKRTTDGLVEGASVATGSRCATLLMLASRARDLSRQGATLEDAQFDMEKFLRVLTEVADHQAEITGKPHHVVVECRIGEEFPYRALIRIHLRRGVAHVRRCIAQVGKNGIVGSELAESALCGAHISYKCIAVVDNPIGTFLHARVINQFSQRALLVPNSSENLIDASDGGVRLVVEIVGRDEFSHRALSSLDRSHHGVEFGRRVVQVVIERRVIHKLAEGPTALLHLIDDVAQVIAERT